MNNPIVAELQAHKWAMEPMALKAFIERMAELPATSILQSVAVVQKPAELRILEGTAIIPISGILLKTVPGWLKFFDIEATSYVEIRSQLRAALASVEVTRIHLQIDSPGGQVDGVVETADAIFAARSQKPVTATIEDLGASAAYWLASQAETVTAANRNTEAGSIGVYTVYVDWTKADERFGVKVIVIRSGEHKGMGADSITENQIAAVQEIVDRIADNFIEAVAEGRGKDPADIRELATGQLWIAAAARDLGLIDQVMDARQEQIQSKANIASKASKGDEADKTIKGDSLMDNEKTEQVEQVDSGRIADEAKDAERNRMAELAEAFADDPQFAIEAFNRGLSVTEARSEYCDVLRDKLKDKAKDKAQETPATSEAQVSGAEAIATGDTDEASGGDFMAEAKEVAAEKKITLTAAMQQLARSKPELRKAFLERCKTEGKAMYAEAV
jgi:signal peptide peptidase SppA